MLGTPGAGYVVEDDFEEVVARVVVTLRGLKGDWWNWYCWYCFGGYWSA